MAGQGILGRVEANSAYITRYCGNLGLVYRAARFDPGFGITPQLLEWRPTNTLARTRKLLDLVELPEATA
jgi:hypothetical protein